MQLTITLDTASTDDGPFDTDADYAAWVLRRAIASWREQYAGSTPEGALQAARLAYNASITPADSETPAVPLEVTARQARLALLGAGMDGAVDAAINAMPAGPQKRAAQITWEYSLTVQRYNPLITQMAAALNLTPQQIDQLFITAKGL